MIFNRKLPWSELAVGITAFAAAFLLAHFLLPHFFAEIFSNHTEYGNILFQGLVLIPLIVFLKSWFSVDNLNFGFNGITWLQFILIIVGSILIGVSSGYIAITFLGNYSNTPIDHDQLGSIPLFVSAVLVAPILEEVLMRGVLQEYLHRSFSPWATIITTAVIFSVMHGSLFQAVGVFGAGIGFSYIYYRTKSLSLVILIHGFHNFLAVRVLSNEIQSNQNSDTDLIMIVTALISMVFMTWIGYKILKRATRTATTSILTNTSRNEA